jgi:hypothetical protein
MPEDFNPQILQQPQVDAGMGYGELNPPEPMSQAEGVIAQNPTE